jgi:uncharacterized protein involved in type VI secretion and phage assembly
MGREPELSRDSVEGLSVLQRYSATAAFFRRLRRRKDFIEPACATRMLSDVRGAQGLLAQIAGSVLGTQIETQTQDTVNEFAAGRRIGTNAVTLGSWDYTRVAGVTGQTESSLDLGDLPALEAYDGAGAYRYESTAHAARAAELRLQAHELAYKTFDGRGYVRTLAAGRTFTLIDHPHYGPNSTALNLQIPWRPSPSRSS